MTYYHAKRQKVELVSETVALALDRTKTSSRSGTHILAAAATTLGYKIKDVKLSHSTIHRRRQIIRTKMAAQLKSNLQVSKHLTVHWDGKILPEFNNVGKVERLPIIVSGFGCDQLLGVPKVDGTAANQAQSDVETLYESNLQDRIRAMCFDTTNVNTAKL